MSPAKSQPRRTPLRLRGGLRLAAVLGLAAAMLSPASALAQPSEGDDVPLIPLPGGDGKDGAKKKKDAGKGDKDGKGKDAKKSRKIDKGSGPWRNVYADDWWTMSQPSLELHGHLRVRGRSHHGDRHRRTGSQHRRSFRRSPSHGGH